MSRHVKDFTPPAGYAAKYGATGLISDPFAPTTAYQLNAVRNYAREQAAKHGAQEVRFTVHWLHQFDTEVTIDARGFIVRADGLDLSGEQLARELEQLG